MVEEEREVPPRENDWGSIERRKEGKSVIIDTLPVEYDVFR